MAVTNSLIKKFIEQHPPAQAALQQALVRQQADAAAVLATHDTAYLGNLAKITRATNAVTDALPRVLGPAALGVLLCNFPGLRDLREGGSTSNGVHYLAEGIAGVASVMSLGVKPEDTGSFYSFFHQCISSMAAGLAAYSATESGVFTAVVTVVLPVWYAVARKITTVTERLSEARIAKIAAWEPAALPPAQEHVDLRAFLGNHLARNPTDAIEYFCNFLPRELSGDITRLEQQAGVLAAERVSVVDTIAAIRAVPGATPSAIECGVAPLEERLCALQTRQRHIQEHLLPRLRAESASFAAADVSGLYALGTAAAETTIRHLAVHAYLGSTVAITESDVLIASAAQVLSQLVEDTEALRGTVDAALADDKVPV